MGEVSGEVLQERLKNLSDNFNANNIAVTLRFDKTDNKLDTILKEMRGFDGRLIANETQIRTVESNFMDFKVLTDKRIDALEIDSSDTDNLKTQAMGFKAGFFLIGKILAVIVSVLSFFYTVYSFLTLHSIIK